MRFNTSILVLVGLIAVLIVYTILKKSPIPKPKKEGFQTAITLSPPVSVSSVGLLLPGDFIKAPNSPQIFWKPFFEEKKFTVPSTTMCSRFIKDISERVATVSSATLDSYRTEGNFTCDLLWKANGKFVKKPGSSDTFWLATGTKVLNKITDCGSCPDFSSNVCGTVDELSSSIVSSYTDGDAFKCSMLTTPASESDVPCRQIQYFIDLSNNMSKYDPYRTAYDKYEEDEAPTADEQAGNTINVEEEELPDFGGLSEFDPEKIPWDADNRGTVASKMVWGLVTDAASASIFRRSYHQSLLGNINNLGFDGSAYTYDSPLFNVSTDNAQVGAALQAAEMATMMAAPMALEKAAGATSAGLSKVKSRIQSSKVNISGSSVSRKKVGGSAKNFLGRGGKKIKEIGSKIASKLAPQITKRIALSQVKGAAMAAIPVIGVVISAVVLPLCGALALVAPVILENLLDTDAACLPGYTPLDQVIPPYANEILSLIPGFGDILSTFYPYACFSSGGDMKLKEALVEPPYWQNAAYSMYFRDKPDLSSETPPQDPSNVSYKWCDYSSPIMLDRMAQFYYDNAIRRAEANDDGTITFSYISKISSTIASSEFSCDITCDITEVTFDPISNCKVNIKTSGGHDRRFYFYAAPSDPQRVFTVTGCTFDDYTAPEAEGGVSLPATYVVNTKPPKNDASQTTKNILGGLAVSAAGGSMLGTAVTMAMEKNGTMDSIRGAVGVTPTNAVDPDNPDQFMDSNGNLVNDFKYYTINIGYPIANAIGYVPKISRCQKSLVTDAQCTNRDMLRYMIDTYHQENPTKHIKTLTRIQARGLEAQPQGCYYKFNEVGFDPNTNIESRTTAEKEVVLTFKMPNTLTCGLVPSTLSSNISNFAVRQYNNPATGQPMTDASGNPVVPRSFPKVPFQVPTPIPAETNLGGSACPPTTKCSSKAQLERLITQYNAANPLRKIIKVLRVVTPKPNRCDLEVQMLRMNATATGSSVGQKESVSIFVKPAPASDGTCMFDYESDGGSVAQSGGFIQYNSPPAMGDISGGIGFVDSFMKDLRTTYNTFLAPFLSIKPSEKISSESGVLRKTTDTAFEAVYNTQVLDGCPTKKCNSPDILKAIMTQYNIENAPTGQYAVEKHTMSKVLKAGIASKNECDIMFANQVEKFDDIMYDPVDTRVYAKVLRFKLKHEGNCVFSVVPSQSYDVSSNAIGLRSDTSALPTAYTGPACQVDCRNTTLLRRLKEVYEEATPRTTLKKIVQSYTAGSGTCEYRILKDTTYDDPDEGVPVTLRDVATFLRVNYAVSDASICKYDLRGRSDLTEVDPEKIEFDEEEEEPVPMINGVQVVVPSLASYDESKRSKKVNATPIGPTF